MAPIVERYADRIMGMLSCFDRFVLTGTLVDIGHAIVVAIFLTGIGDVGAVVA